MIVRPEQVFEVCGGNLVCVLRSSARFTDRWLLIALQAVGTWEGNVQPAD